MNGLETGKGFTLWFTGLSGAGKSTDAYNGYIQLFGREDKR
jgi:adenylylsulfate kinase-like enzyme